MAKTICFWMIFRCDPNSFSFPDLLGLIPRLYGVSFKRWFEKPGSRSGPGEKGVSSGMRPLSARPSP